MHWSNGNRVDNRPLLNIKSTKRENGWETNKFDMFKDILLGDTILSRSEKEKVSQVFERLQRECGVFISRYISKNESPILGWKMEITRVQNMFAKFFGMYKRRAIKIS